MAPLKNVWQHKKLNIHVVPTKLHYATTHYFKHKIWVMHGGSRLQFEIFITSLHVCQKYSKKLLSDGDNGRREHTFWFSNSDVVSVH